MVQKKAKPKAPARQAAQRKTAARESMSYSTQGARAAALPKGRATALAAPASSRAPRTGLTTQAAPGMFGRAIGQAVSNVRKKKR